LLGDSRIDSKTASREAVLMLNPIQELARLADRTASARPVGSPADLHRDHDLRLAEKLHRVTLRR
jgi:hypothetical protein